MPAKAFVADVAAITIAAFITSAKADSIVENQWYTGHLGFTGTPLLGDAFYGDPARLGVNGPLLGGGGRNAVDASDVGGC
jgi:hypothetical protein